MSWLTDFLNITFKCDVVNARNAREWPIQIAVCLLSYMNDFGKINIAIQQKLVMIGHCQNFIGISF